MPKSKYCSYDMKTFYDVILNKLWPKNAQILESDFGKPQNLPLPYLSSSNFQELFVMKFDSKSNQFEAKNFLLKRFSTKKARKGAKIISIKKINKF